MCENVADRTPAMGSANQPVQVGSLAIWRRKDCSADPHWENNDTAKLPGRLSIEIHMCYFLEKVSFSFYVDETTQKSQGFAEPWHRAQCILFLSLDAQVENHVTSGRHLSAHSSAENWPTYPVNSVHNVRQTVRSLFLRSTTASIIWDVCEAFLWEFWSWATGLLCWLVNALKMFQDCFKLHISMAHSCFYQSSPIFPGVVVFNKFPHKC